MAATLKRLYQGSPTAETAVYTAPTSTKTLVKQIKVCNTAATAGTVSVSVVPGGGTGGAANRILAGKSVPANDTLILDDFDILNAADSISAILSASTMVITISGVEGV